MTELGDAIEVELHPSRRLLLLLLAAHALAVLALFRSGLHPLLCGSLILVLALHGHYVHRRHYALLDPRAVAALRWGLDGWQLRFAGGHWRAAEPVGEMVVTASVLLIRFRVTDQSTPVPVLILSDSGDPDEIRRLRVRLRFGQPA